MATFSKQIKINAPKNRVWEILSDLGGIYKWNPGVSNSYLTSDDSDGEGGSRHCDLQNGKGGNIGYLEERSFDWREGEGFTIDVYESNLPLKRNHVRFDLEPDGDGTIVRVTPDYKLKFGPLGMLADVLGARRQFKKGMEGLLEGLRYHIETGEVVEQRVPTAATTS